MAEELLMRLSQAGDCLIPLDEQEAERLQQLQRVRGVLKVKVGQRRASLFHRKGMKLFRVLYDLWEPVLDEVDGVPVRKDFDAFRENLTIKAGYYEQVFDLDGGFRLRAKSLKWDQMDNIEFDRVYNEVINVGLRMIGKATHLTPAEIDAAVDRVMTFA